MQKFILIATTFFMTGLLIYALPAKGQTVAGKIYFSNQPFSNNNVGSKKNFISGEYIYGRLELDSTTIQKAFRIFEPNENYPHAYFFYRVYIYYNGKEMGFNSSVNLCLLKGNARKNNWFNFDVLPEPAKATTVLGGTYRFEYYTLGTAPLYRLIDPYNFKQNGEYKILVKFYYESYDVWNNMEPVEKWPKLEEEFSFMFSDKDVPMLKKNEAAANAVIQKKGLR